MSKYLQSIRGMHDVLPQQSPLWQHLETIISENLHNYGYAEIRTPVLEPTVLFTRSIGAATDIVEKEMYTFEDRNEENLSLRPEGTASIVRSVLQHGLLSTPGQKVWYRGPMFRYERPQRGRFRQFHQIGAEVFGLDGPDIDAELLAMTARMWKQLGLLDQLELQINTLGSSSERQAYKAHLQAWFRERISDLDEDSKRRLETNPMRILDSKNPDMQVLLEQAPTLEAHLGEASRLHFSQLKNILSTLGVQWHYNPRLVRGLDYYSHTVFEWVSSELGAQSAVCAGGRYNTLVELHGGPSTPGIGFAMGQERLIDLLEQRYQREPNPADVVTHAYLILAGDKTQAAGMQLLEQCRETNQKLRLICNHNGGSFRAQFKRADRSGAQIAIILGEQELQQGLVTVKWLRQEQEQQDVTFADLPAWLSKQFDG